MDVDQAVPMKISTAALAFAVAFAAGWAAKGCATRPLTEIATASDSLARVIAERDSIRADRRRIDSARLAEASGRRALSTGRAVSLGDTAIRLANNPPSKAESLPAYTSSLRGVTLRLSAVSDSALNDANAEISLLRAILAQRDADAAELQAERDRAQELLEGAIARARRPARLLAYARIFSCITTGAAAVRQSWITTAVSGTACIATSAMQ